MLNQNEITELLRTDDPESVRHLLQEADQVRRQYVGDEVHLRALVEFSNYCRRDCLYCGLRRSNRRVVRYHMTMDEIYQATAYSSELGLKTIVLQSGEDLHYSIDDLCALVTKIKSQLGMSITMSIGERTHEDYRRLKEAGAERYLIRFETSDPKLFQYLKPDSQYAERFRCLDDLRELGYQVGSGNMVGLPGQTLESIAADILLFNKLNLDMIGLGPFIPHPDTPLKDSESGTLDLVLRATALTRIVTQNAHMPATTATGTIDLQGRQKALQCGANVMMPNMTPRNYREHYMLYADKICVSEEAGQCRFCMEGMVNSIGRSVSTQAGHSLKMFSQEVGL